MKLKLAAALLLLAFACTQNDSQEEIRIGFYAPLTGNVASFGNMVRRGIELGIEELNQKGLNGKRIRLFTEDDRGNPEEAQSAVSRLITRDRVVAILGDPTSSCSLAGGPVCQQFKIPMLTPTATNPKVTQQGDFLFRVCWTDSYQGETMAEFAVRDLKARRIAIFNDVSSDYSTGLADVFARRVEALGAAIVSRHSYNVGDTNFTAQLTSIQKENPDLLFLPTYYNETGLILRQLRSMHYSVPAIGTDGWDSPQLAEIGGDAVNGTYYCTHFLASDPAPTVQHFVSLYRHKHKAEPFAGEALGYDAIRLLAQAMMRSSFSDAQKIRNALASTKNFAGVTGQITMDANRNAQKALIIVRFENGSPKVFRKLESKS